MAKREILIPGGEGRSFTVKKGESIVITDIEGKQVADFIALNAKNKEEYFSTAHTRMMNGRINVKKGDILYSNLRNPMFEFVEDVVGVHDTMFPCCDPLRYSLDFGIENHRNCRTNFAEAFQKYGIGYHQIPDPFNLFQNSPLQPDGSFGEAQEPKSQPGDYVIFQALTDVIAGISACPMDQTPLCGWKITDIKATIIEKLHDK